MKAIKISVSILFAAVSLQAYSQNIIKDTLDFDKAMTITPATMIKGHVPGVRVSPIDGNVNGAVSTLIRGVNALRTDSQPLWIVDGVLINSSLTQNNDAFFQYHEKSYTPPLNALSYLNEYDIESIEVLKDLSATSLYGSRGANGVIIIKTRLPEYEGARFSFTSNVGLSTPADDVIGTRTALSHNHYFNLASAKGQTKYIISAFYRENYGIVPDNDNRSGGLRATFDTKANNILWFGMNASIGLSKMNSIAGTSYFGQPSLTMTMRQPDFFAGDTFEGWAADFDDEAIDRRLTNSMYLTFHFSPFLKLKTTLGVDYQNNDRYIWYGDGTTFGFDNDGAAAILGTSIFKYNAQALLTWDKYIGRDHKVTTNVAIEASGDWTKFNTMSGTRYYTHVLRSRGLNFTNSVRKLHKFIHDYNTHGAYADVNYTYQGAAGVSARIRGDRAPRYDDSRFILYGGADAFVDLHRYLLPDSDVISALKFKAGYGEAGREQYVPYGLYNYFIPGSYESVPAELQCFYEALNRVRSREFNIGLDLGLLEDRVSLHLGYYDKTTTDAFHAYCFGEKPEGKDVWNFADRKDDFSQSSRIGNRGLEFEVDADIIDNSKLRWTAFANAAYNVNQMLDVSPEDYWGRKVGNDLFVNCNVIGFPVGTLYGFSIDSNGNPIDVTRDNRLNEQDKDIIGNPNPKVYGAVGSTFAFGRFHVDMIVDGAFGFDILNLNKLLFEEFAPYYVSGIYVEKGDYLKLSRLSAGYSFGMNKTRWIRSIDLRASALNLFTLTGYSGWDPEVNCFGVTYLSSGVDYGSYPASRAFILGATINF